MDADAGDAGERTPTDAATLDGLDADALYVVVRRAVEDAILAVIGTLLLLGVALVLVAAGAESVLRAESTVASAAGLLLVGVGLYLGAATLEVVPPVREWF